MKNKSNWEYNKKKQERKRIKKELKNSKKNTGSIELAKKQMEKFINNQKLKEESKQKLKEKERSKKLIDNKKDQPVFKCASLQQYDAKKKYWMDKIIKLQDERNKSKDQNTIDEINKELDKYQNHVEILNIEINKFKIILRKEDILKIKRPENLKNLIKFKFDSSKILLDSNVIIDLSYRHNEESLSNNNKYKITHKIKSICNYDKVEVIIPSFVLRETRILLDNYITKPLLEKENLVFTYLNSELNGIFGKKWKEEEVDKEVKEDIKKKFQEIVDDHHKKNLTVKKLSEIDAKCLLYAKHLNAVLISNDQQLLNECKSKNVLCYNHIKGQDPEFDQTIISNREEWFVGKIKRLKIFWNDIQTFENNRKYYDEKTKLLQELFHILYTTDDEIKRYLHKICESTNSKENIKQFFRILSDKPDLTLDDIESKITEIVN